MRRSSFPQTSPLSIPALILPQVTYPLPSPCTDVTQAMDNGRSGEFVELRLMAKTSIVDPILLHTHSILPKISMVPTPFPNISERINTFIIIPRDSCLRSS